MLVARTATRWPALPLKFARELPPAEVTATGTDGPPGVIEYVAAPAGTTEAARTLRLRRRWTQDVLRAASVRGPWERTGSLPPQIEDDAEETCMLKIVNCASSADHPSGS